MDEQIQLAGLDRFLTNIYGEETTLAGMIDALGFEPHQARLLHDNCLPAFAALFIDAVRRKITSGDEDLWFRVLSRRFGLDGEQAVSLEEAARVLGVDYGEARRAETAALEKCRTKTAREEFRKSLHRMALHELTQGSARPSRDQVAAKLTRLADLHAALDLTRMDYENKKAELMKKVQAELDALESEYQPLLDAAKQNAETLESEIKNDVLLRGQSVVTDFYQAVYMKGRVTWDPNGMKKYALAHPDVLEYRKEGQPSVQLRAVAKK